MMNSEQGTMGSALGNGRRVLAEEVPVGYKRTEVGVIPEDWREVEIGLLANVVRGASPRPIDSPVWFDAQSEIGWLRISDVTASGKFLYDTTQNLSPSGIANSRFVKSGNLVMSICATVGRPIITRKDVCIHDGFVVFDNLRADKEYLYYFLSNIEASWSKHGQTGSQMNLNTDLINSTSVSLPSPTEQRAIAEALSGVDGLLAALEVLIAKKRAIKQAAMQQLLTGKSRLPGFSGTWETRRLGDTFTCLPTANNPRADLREYGQIGYIHYGDVHAHAQPVLNCAYYDLPWIDRSRVDNAAHLQDGDLVMVDASEDLVGIGKSIEIHGIAEKTIVAGLHTILCRGNPDYWAMGFKAYLQFIPAFKSALIRMATGISVYAISKKQLSDIELALPSLLEQEAIVSVLSDMDAEIAALERRRDKTRVVKQGMMQQLLTGRARLVKQKQV